MLSLVLALVALCAANNSIKFDSELSNWIQRTWRVENELQAINSAIGSGAGTNNLLLLQTPQKRINKFKRDKFSSDNDILSVDSLMIHLEALAIATHATVEMFDLTWSLKDICFTPTPPDYEGLLPNLMLENLMPCAIKTPLDCFWEGAKLLGPDDYRLSSIGPKIRWTDMNPRLMIEAMQRNHPRSSFPYASLLDWMQRVGITSGYVEKPCLDPTDPNCPTTSPNKISGLTPNIAAYLTGGCSGFASKQMHWREEELLGGVRRNRSGHIEHAEALQSTIQLMAEQDVYDYWRKTDKVKDVHNWSAEKAKLVLDGWQAKFKQELEQFTKSSLALNNYKIYAMTPDSMLEPISIESVTDSTNFKMAAGLMTLFACLLFPNFQLSHKDTSTPNTNQKQAKQSDESSEINRVHVTLLAITASILICTTFIASLGLSSFMNLSLNMATSQLLPPLALYYGFKQALMIANIYAYNLNRHPLDDLTTECLNELLPETLLEFVIHLVPLVMGLFIPVTAIRVFTYQSIIYICLATITSILVIPSLLTSFVTYFCRADSSDQAADDSLEDQIFSRIQNDLKNVRADSQTSPADINFIANFSPNGFSTNLSLRASPTIHRAKQCDTQTTLNTTDKTQHFTYPNVNRVSPLPDLVLWPSGLVDQNDLSDSCEKKPTINEEAQHEVMKHEIEETEKKSAPIVDYSSVLSNKFAQMTILITRLIIFIAIMSKSFNLEYGLQVSDIIVRNTMEHDAFLVQEKYFPIHNMYIVTKGSFDYANNQRLLYEFHKRIGQVDGVIGDDEPNRSKFWLVYFRDWLIELQERFDIDRNRSAISSQGWREEDEVSDTSKLAYKLLAQTGRIENPIDRNQVETNRLVDKNGIINPKAFYYYLTAWVMCDAFSYSSSEANLRPEPKTWNDDPTELRIERARPINYAQIPYMIRLPSNRDTISALIEIRSISQAFEQLNLPNFPTGVPFIFWDQFLNLDLQFFAAAAMVAGSLYVVVALILSDLLTATMLTAPLIMSLMELYGIIGHLSIPFNNIIAALVINFLGLAGVQTIHYVIYFTNKDGDVMSRWIDTLRRRSRIVLSSLVLSLICVAVFRVSRIEFMTRYSTVLLGLVAINSYNALLVVPTILRLCGKDHKPKIKHRPHQVDSNSARPKQQRRTVTKQRIRKKSSSKKRGYPRVQSEISLSTISEEPQSEIKLPDLKLGLSINVNY